MTVPNLTASGYMLWPLRAWVESLCTPLPDGTWLVQAPITGKQEPRFYLLPDVKTKEQYLRWATAKGWINALVQSLASLFVALVLVSHSLYLVIDVRYSTILLVRQFIIFLPLLLWLLAYLIVTNRLSGLLFDVRIESAETWLRQGVIVRRAVEWDAMYLSRVLPVAFIAHWSSIGLIVGIGVLFVVTRLDACGTANLLSGTFIEYRRFEKPEEFFICRHIYLGMGSLIFAIALLCATLIASGKNGKRVAPSFGQTDADATVAGRGPCLAKVRIARMEIGHRMTTGPDREARHYAHDSHPLNRMADRRKSYFMSVSRPFARALCR